MGSVVRTPCALWAGLRGFAGEARIDAGEIHTADVPRVAREARVRMPCDGGSQFPSARSTVGERGT